MAFELNPFSQVLKENKNENEKNDELIINNNKKNKHSEEDSDKIINKIKFKNAKELYAILQKNIKKYDENEKENEKIEKEIIFNNIIKKYVYDVNTFKYKQSLRCKLISDNTYIPSLTFKCPLVIEAGYRAFFEIPFIYNITTFEWEFNDLNSKERLQTSDKSIACHIFEKPGEYTINLFLRVFEFREYNLSKKVWVIP